MVNRASNFCAQCDASQNGLLLAAVVPRLATLWQIGAEELSPQALASGCMLGYSMPIKNAQEQVALDSFSKRKD
jgi:hypothetical protein